MKDRRRCITSWKDCFSHNTIKQEENKHLKGTLHIQQITSTTMKHHHNTITASAQALPIFFLILGALTLATSSATADRLFLDPMFSVGVERNIIYGPGEVRSSTGGEIDLKLDLYAPTNGTLPSQVPAVVLVHGGGFTGGDKLQFRDLARHFASRGYVAVSINYRLAGDKPPRLPEGQDTLNTVKDAAVVDASLAVSWMRGNNIQHHINNLLGRGDTLAIDHDRVSIGGASAGAITSLLVGMTNRSSITHPEVATVIDLWGGLSPFIGDVDVSDPPLFIVHGTEDPSDVPITCSEELVEKAESVGVPFEYFPIEGAGHGVDLDTVAEGMTLLEHLFIFQFEQLGLADVCVTHSDCVGAGSYCYRDTCYDIARSDGERCFRDFQCQSKHCVSNTCSPGLNGDPCEGQGDCSDNLNCAQNMCTDGRLGSHCVVALHCQSSYCVSGECTSGAHGQPCFWPDDCDGYCNHRVCYDGREGDRCSIHIDCQSRHCPPTGPGNPKHCTAK